MTKYETAAIDKAVRILESRLSYHQQPPISSPEASKQLCFLKLGDKPDEHFAVAFLTKRHQLLSFETLFRGTVDGASVHPRVVVRRALELNAAAVILSHNHHPYSLTHFHNGNSKKGGGGETTIKTDTVQRTRGRGRHTTRIQFVALPESGYAQR